MRLASSVLMVILATAGHGVLQADVPLPPRILNPASTAEAWNVIRLSTGNVARLIQEKRLLEITEQIALCSPALRLLAQSYVPPDQKRRVDELIATAFSRVNSIAQACMAQSHADAERTFGELQTTLRGIGESFDPGEVAGEMYHCRAHPEIVAAQDGGRCRHCKEPLIVRRIPYSFIYAQSERPTLKLAARADAPLAAGTLALVKVSLQTQSGQPVKPADLLVMHGHPVHVLVTDQKLGDFHQAQPVATDVPGEYSFSFTPAAAGPHRIWADVVPVATGLQDCPFADLGGEFKAVPAPRQGNLLVASSGGLRFNLALSQSSGGQVHARRIQFLKLTVTDDARQPVTRLEPVLNAFAHLVGFYDDHQSVLRLHPVGGDILLDDVRGGPALGFKIYPPRTGFIRFFCLVKVDGGITVAPFGLNIVE